MRRFADFGTFEFERAAGCGCVLVRGHFFGDGQIFALERKGFAWQLIWDGGWRRGAGCGGVDQKYASVFETNLNLIRGSWV